ncbi:non-canonical purine NTP phosphatase [Alginatibacterium sediminis]|uniref:Inosine/xanthosine triphosphatase n=1 Tax=Alginatibacterium sediminis TaxID=2164068 RepID=A0A420ELC8_9ALTE|nr:inosine/xanthosine triphosphatase [Alginatibacterium sediminis]RKF21483.1 non-canonical purine NTP phosphatase [Alginatibacterium sediminis]
MQKSLIRVVVASQNPVKVAAIRNAIAAYNPQAQLEVQGIDAPSGVREQPLSNAETRLGALNRLEFCQTKHQADYYAAIEGGVDNFEDGPATFAYVVIADGRQTSVGRGAQLPLPMSVYQSLCEGQELGPLMDQLFNTHNIKQKGGAIGLLTNGLASRQGNYEQAAILAMSRFASPKLFGAKDNSD